MGLGAWDNFEGFALTPITVDSVLSARAAGDLPRAIERISRLFALRPDAADVAQLAGVLYCEAVVYERGLTFLKMSSRLASADKQVWLNLALAHRHQGQHAEALGVAQRVILLDPQSPTLALSVARYAASPDLKSVFIEMAKRVCRWSLLLDPLSFEAAYFHGMAHKRNNEFSEAVTSLSHSVVLAPSIAAPLVGLGDTLAEMTQFSASQQCYRWACNADPVHHDAPYHLSLVQLRIGHFEDGWANYEHRWFAAVGKEHLSESLAVRASRPEYTGINRPKRLLIWGEQGIGDEIMFGSLLAEFQHNCDELLVQLDPRLIDLFSRSLPRVRFFGFDKPPTPDLYDEQLPIGSLGKFLRPTRASFAGKGRRYLSAAEGSAWKLRSDLGVAKHEQLIGLCWRAANPDNRQIRSLPLETLLKALSLPGLRFLNLQYANVDKELSLLDPALGSRLLRHPDIDLTKNLDGVAGLIEACDLVISVGNAVAHLSGALGQRTWVLLPQVAGWRWLHGSTTCGWYESVRLFRQERRGDWNGVLSDLRAAIDHDMRNRQ